MKKKSLLLLASALLGFGLVGGTLATWAVTDNADPFNIGISPGRINTDTTSAITLSWGSSQSIGDVSNLTRTETRKAGVLDLRADTASALAVNGQLSLELTGSSALTSLLNVDVYKGNIAEYNAESAYAKDAVVIRERAVYKAAKALEAGSELNETNWTPVEKVTFTTGNAIVPIVRNEANPYTVIVYLSTSITQTEYDNLRAAGAQASVQFDWGIDPSEDTSEGTPIFFSGWDNPYVYAFKGENDKNAAWPGKPMSATLVSSVYTYVFDSTKYDTVVFTNAEGTVQTTDIAFTTLTAAGKNWCKADIGETVTYTVDTYNPTTQPVYYLRGQDLKITATDYALDWNANPAKEYQITAAIDPTDGVTVRVTTTAENARLKFYESVANKWYGENSSTSDDFVLGLIGTYDLTFKPNNGSAYITAVKI